MTLCDGPRGGGPPAANTSAGGWGPMWPIGASRGNPRCSRFRLPFAHRFAHGRLVGESRPGFIGVFSHDPLTARLVRAGLSGRAPGLRPRLRLRRSGGGDLSSQPGGGAGSGARGILRDARLIRALSTAKNCHPYTANRIGSSGGKAWQSRWQ